MASIDQQFVEFIVKSLVGNPDAVEIKRSIDEKGVLLELTVAPEDIGRVIGKRGSTAQSIRSLLRTLGTKNDARYNLKIVDPTGGFNPGLQQASKGDDENEDEATSSQANHSNVVSKTRQELADLDDLDV